MKTSLLLCRSVPSRVISELAFGFLWGFTFSWFSWSTLCWFPLRDLVLVQSVPSLFLHRRGRKVSLGWSLMKWRFKPGGLSPAGRLLHRLLLSVTVQQRPSPFCLVFPLGIVGPKWSSFPTGKGSKPTRALPPPALARLLRTSQISVIHSLQMWPVYRCDKLTRPVKSDL